MATQKPVIVNTLPHPLAPPSAVDVDAYLRFGLRDVDTYVNRSTIQVGIAYGNGYYDPAKELVLPEDVEDLTDPLGTTSIHRGFFDDWAGTASGLEPLLDASTGHLLMTKATGGQERSFYSIIDSAVEGRSFHAEVRVDLAPAGGGAALYFNDARYRGLMLGLVSGLRNRGVFVFFCEDAGVPLLVVCGPATASGVRTVLAEVPFDWTVPGNTYKLVWNEYTSPKSVEVYASDAAGETTRILWVHMTTLDQFHETAVVGGEVVSSSGKAMLVFGVDGPAGTLVTADLAAQFLLGGRAVHNGQRCYNHGAIVTPDHLIRLGMGTLPENLLVSPWLPGVMTGSVLATSTRLTLTKESTDNHFLPLVYTREEPALGTAGWMLRGYVLGSSSSYLGSNLSGMGVLLDTGDRLVHLALLDDYAEKFLGVQTSPAGSLIQETTYTKIPDTDWSDGVPITIIADPARNELDIFVGEDLALTVSYSPANLAPSAGVGARVTFGHATPMHLPSGSYGDFILQELWYSTNVVSYCADHLVLPEAAATPWVRDPMGAGAISVGAGGLTIQDDSFGAAGSPLMYRRMETYLVPSHAAFVEARYSIESWSDDVGSPNPVDHPIAMAMYLDDIDSVAALVAVKTATGRTFVYVPSVNDPETLAAVVQQTEEGEARSLEIDWTELHTYRLERSPGEHVRLYADNAVIPAIDLTWDEADLPNGGMALQPSVGFGSGAPNQKAKGVWKFVRYGIGRGYDLAVRRELTTDEMREHAFDGGVNLLIEASDVDP
jgi:hypothetical protein